MSLLNKENKKNICSLDFEIALFFKQRSVWTENKRWFMRSHVDKFVRNNIIDILKDDQFAIKGLSNIWKHALEWLKWDTLSLEYDTTYKNEIDIFFKQDAYRIDKCILKICIISPDDYTYQFFKSLLNNRVIPVI